MNGWRLTKALCGESIIGNRSESCYGFNALQKKSPFLDPDAKMAYWHAKQEWRRGLTTTEM